MTQILTEMQRQIEALRRDVERLRSIDKLSTPTVTLTIANGATAYPFGNVASPGAFAGAFIVNELTAGQTALFLTGGIAISKVSDPGGIYTTTAGTPAKINVYLDGNYNVVIQNNLTTRDILVTGIRTRFNN
jgi:hypothetical protein